MCDSDFLSRCSSYEADFDSDSDSDISTSSSSSTYSESEEVISYELSTKKLEKIQKKKKSNVLLEGYVVDTVVNDDLKRTKSLTDDDLEELKGCVDLGFGFNYEEIPELCNTLPALELCYSMTHKFIDHHTSPEKKSQTMKLESQVSPIASWKISSPGDNPDEVKARLRFWAQAVACTVRLCT